MKKAVILLMSLLFLLPMVVATTSSVNVPVNNEVSMQIEVAKTIPFPVEPGQYFDLWIALESEGGSSSSNIINRDDLSDVEIELIEDYPFSLDPDDDAIKIIGILRMGEQVVVKYRVKVSEDASSGEHDLRFMYRDSSNPDGIESGALDITVQAVDTTMNVVSIETVPEQLSLGKPAQLAITVRNDAPILFKNIEAVLDIDRSTIPIVPYKSSKELNIQSLDSSESYTFTFDIIAEEDAAAGVYKIPLSLRYRDANNSLYTRNDTFGILIGADADLAFSLEEFDTFQKGVSGDVVAAISNIGPTELKFMTIELLESDSYVILGASEEYLGNLDSDDFETSSYNIYIEDDDDVQLQFLVTYKDTYNEEFEEAFSLSLPVYSKTEVQAYGLDGETRSLGNYIFYLLLLFFVYYVYKGWAKEKRLDKSLRFALKNLVLLPFRIVFWFRLRNLRRLPKKIRLFFRGL